MGFKLRSVQSLRNIDVSEEIYSAGGNDGSLISRPDTECLDCEDFYCSADSEEVNDMCSLFLSLLFIIEVGFNILYSLLGMYNTTLSDVWSKCPENHMWLYLLFTTVLLNFIHHIGIKGLREIENKKGVLCTLFIVQISNFGFSLIGEHYSSGDCVSSKFDDTLLWKMVNYNIILQKIIAIMLLIPEIGLVYSIYVKNKRIKDKRIKDAETDTKSRETKSRENNQVKIKSENIKIKIIENDRVEEGDKEGEEEGEEEGDKEGENEDENKQQNQIITRKETD